MKIFIVKTAMSSPFHIDETTEIDSRREERLYHYEKDVRQDIGAVRARHRKPIYTHCVNFHGLYICNDKATPLIEAAVKQADVEFKAIAPELASNVKFIPLDVGAITGDNGLYVGINNSIKKRVFGDVFKKMDKVLQKRNDISDRSKKAILNLTAHMRAINILEDEGVTAEIDRIESIISGKIEGTSVKVLHDEIDKKIKELDLTMGRFSQIEV
jgi:hypothetical protein